jgi:hypothetical protein
MTYKLAAGFTVFITVIVLAASCGYLEEELEYQRAAPQTLAEKLDWLNSHARDNKEYLIIVNGEESLAPCELKCNNKTNVTVRLQGGTVTLSGSGSMFTVERGVTLILDNITLKGSSSNTHGLVLHILINGTIQPAHFTVEISSILYFQRNITGSSLMSSKY